MKKMNKYPISNFYVGELYLYTSFGNLMSGSDTIIGREQIESFSQTSAIGFQKDLLSKYVDWENRREYTGFLTIFYKQDNQYICLHDGKTYILNSPYIIDNLVPLSDVMPKRDVTSISKISMYDALELFDILFVEEDRKQTMYRNTEMPITDFFVGDIALRESTPIELGDARRKYIDLPHHIMLENDGLSIYSFGSNNYHNTVYRCLFLIDGVDLYNVNNHQFYNPNEDTFGTIQTFKEYMSDFDIKTPRQTITIPKALKLFKRTIKD